MKVGVIGTGRMGCLHIKHLLAHQMIESISVYDPHLDYDWAREKGLNIEKSESALLNSEIEALFISSPNEYHTSHILAGAKTKKAIFCEKPIGLDIDEIKKALAICEKEQVMLQVGFNRRFDIGIRRLKEQIPLSVGEPHVIKITSRDPAIPSAAYLENAGHLFMDMTIHDFDMVRYLAGCEVTEIYAHGSCLINQDIKNNTHIDTAVVQMRLENGAMAVIDNSRQALYGYDQRVEVFSNQGTLRTENQYESQVKSFNEKGVVLSPFKSFFIERYEDAYVTQLDAFITSVKEQKKPSPNGYDGLQAVRLAQAAITSLKQKKVMKLMENVSHGNQAEHYKTLEKNYV